MMQDIKKIYSLPMRVITLIGKAFGSRAHSIRRVLEQSDKIISYQDAITRMIGKGLLIDYLCIITYNHI